MNEEKWQRDRARPLSITEQQGPSTVCSTIKLRLLLLLLAAYVIKCCQASWIKPVWLCGSCQRCFTTSFSVKATADWDLKGPSCCRKPGNLILTPSSWLLDIYVFFFPVCIYSTSLSPSSLNQGGREKKALPVWSLQDQRRGGKYHFHNIWTS